MLGAVAAVTERVRLCTSIYIAPLRPAAAVAKMVATVDALSNGRMTLGVGAGWLEREFNALGMPFKGRFGRMEDTIRACKVLWTQAPASFHSPTVNFDGVWCLPQPVQPGGPPILIAGDPGGKMAARIAELGDGWIVRTGAIKDPVEESEKITHDIAEIRDAVREAGRDPDQLIFQIGTLAKRDDQGRPDLDALHNQVRRYWDLGIEMVQVSLTQFVDRPQDVKPFLTAVAGSLVG
jgi:probable F420-dependent oxidoreductase